MATASEAAATSKAAFPVTIDARWPNHRFQGAVSAATELASQQAFTVRIRRAMVIAGLQGLVLVAFGLKMPVLIPVGALLTLAAGLWYARTARQSLQIQSEIEDLRAFAQTRS